MEMVFLLSSEKSVVSVSKPLNKKWTVKRNFQKGIKKSFKIDGSAGPALSSLQPFSFKSKLL